MELLEDSNVKAGCRLCLRVTPDLIPIFQEIDSNPNDPLSLPNRISACVGFVVDHCMRHDFQITQMEKLPSKICFNCIQEVDRWFVFRSRAQSTNSLLTKVAVEGYQLVPVSVPSTDSSPEFSGKSTTALVVISESKALSNAQTDDICSKPQSSIKEDNSSSASTDMAEQILAEPEFVCHECGKQFKSAGFLEFHMRTHTGPFKCEHCDFTSRHNSRVYAHSVIHSDERPFKCDQCDKTFKNKAGLKQHKKTHTGIKNFVCDMCDKTFARRDSLTEHRRIHTKETKYTCEHCNAEFIFLKTFKRHKCPARLVLFPQKSQLQPVTESLSDCLEDDDD